MTFLCQQIRQMSHKFNMRQAESWIVNQNFQSQHLLKNQNSQ